MIAKKTENKHPVVTHFRRTLLSGLLLLIPVALTYLIFSFLFDLVDGLLRPAMTWTFHQLGWNWTWPGPGLLAAAVLIYIVGLLAACGVGKRVLDGGQRLLFKVPFLGAVYSTNHQLVESFSGASSTGFQRVVLVEFPRDNTWSLGFLTGISDTGGEERLIMAYVPTAPFPNSGFVIFLPAESVLDTNLSVPDAMQIVFSGGVVSPASIETRKINLDTLSEELEQENHKEPSIKETVKEKIREKGLGGSRHSKTAVALDGPSLQPEAESFQQESVVPDEAKMSLSARALQERRRQMEAAREANR